MNKINDLFVDYSQFINKLSMQEFDDNSFLIFLSNVEKQSDIDMSSSDRLSKSCFINTVCFDITRHFLYHLDINDVYCIDNITRERIAKILHQLEHISLYFPYQKKIVL